MSSVMRSIIGRPWHAALLAVGFAVVSAPLAAQHPARGFADPVLGRWDLEVHGADAVFPSWLEVRLRTESELMGRFVGRFGSARDLGAIEYADGRLRFAVPVQYEARTDDLVFEGALTGDRLEGTTTDERGRTVRWTGRRAPPLTASNDPAWEPPRRLFNGEYLLGWHPRDERHPGCWSIERGELVATPPCVDLVSDAVFDDFALHAEFKYPQGSNSGIYLRGRYEIQIQDDAGRALDPLRMGAVYGFVAPSTDAARAAGEWQTLDVTLVGRRVTVVLNGTTIIAGQRIPGITGGALDSDETAPGPIMLQGDHGPIRFRNLTIRSAR